ncbi:ATP-binding cassette domain-containing protein [Verticiella sediminum]|uniref:ATP-binding cassette domain-containing protein n=1 Tax=Verticiella sediminum TaxID=1247510 RepID=A0A556B0Y1_9BURK|nr:oligopeptide/dipeptide ABC transporter ATP-binding protein [Verticiella sediminum]TSH98858.1 ATP-binding cassette domain-containing protein [Verticiella sediminum]
MNPRRDRILDVRGLRVDYPVAGGRTVRAVDGIDFAIDRGQTLALVGESGCGKSSVARAVMRLETPSAGEIRLEGTDLASLNAAALKARRHRFQMIFQDPISSLNPRRRVRDILAAPLRVNGRLDAQAPARIAAALEQVGIDPAGALERYPHEFSGGQCQRISIARALILEPTLLVCDEPVSALDVSVRAQVLNVLNELRASLGLAMLFISHDLAVVRNVADRLAVMYLGAICEAGPADTVFASPAHPYTVALMSAVPQAEPGRTTQRIPLTGEMPSPIDLPSGCRFRSRCPAAQERCAHEAPAPRELAAGHVVACHFPYALRSKPSAASIPLEEAHA